MSEIDIENRLKNHFKDKNIKAVVQVVGDENDDLLKICINTLGRNRVVGVIMPNLNSNHTKKAIEFANENNIKYHVIPITAAVASVWKQIEYSGVSMTGQAHIDLPDLVRSATLDSVAKSIGGKVVTKNDLS